MMLLVKRKMNMREVIVYIVYDDEQQWQQNAGNETIDGNYC